MSAGTIKAMLLHRNSPIAEKPLQLTEIPCPEPGPGEILVDVSVCAVCRTDLHVIEGDLPAQKMPLIPGHQVVGRVERLGPGCGRFKEGDRVGIAWLRKTCGSCDYCRRGMENLCPDSLYTGYHDDGGYAEKTVVSEAFAYELPEAFSDIDAAPLLCAGIIGYRALHRSEPPEHGKLGLYGFGSSAHVVLQIALHRGYEVYVATRGESHRELARRMGAHWVGDSFDPMPEKVDSAIVFAPAGEIVPAALANLDKGGVVALAGIYMTPVPEMEYESCLFHEKNLRSVEANTRTDGEGLLKEASEIPIRPETTTFPLERANEALIALKRDKIDGTGILLCGSGC
jgi:propanol-preferring alcohol dehydrogenase